MAAWMGPLTAQTTVSGSFEHDGITRSYSFYIPASYRPGTPAPMVIGLHGTGSSGENFATHRDFRPIADTAGFIFVYPDGSRLLGLRYWNFGNVFGSTVDDIGFIDALIDTIAAKYSLDTNRLYCTGMSNGAFMAYTLACQSSRLAAIAAVTGSMSVHTYDHCSPDPPIPVMHIHGTEDAINPYEGNSGMIAIDDVTAFWVALNQCEPTPLITAIPDADPGDGATAEHYLYRHGIHGHSVELFKVIGGGHAWPGSPVPGSTETTCMDFDACREIWRFFRQHKKHIPSRTTQIPDASQVQIFPNPARNILHLSADKLVITGASITDMQGRTVLKLQNDNITSLDLSPLPPGFYTIRLDGEGFFLVKKLSIKP